jgi:hypothetical protein
MGNRVRADKTEYEKRIFTIQGWIIEGVQSALIVRQILSSKWCTSQRHAERMMQQARDRWTEIPEAALDQKRKLKIAELQQYKRSMKDVWKGTPSGIRALLEIDKEIILLEGLRKPIKVAQTDSDGKDIDLSKAVIEFK